MRSIARVVLFSAASRALASGEALTLAAAPSAQPDDPGLPSYRTSPVLRRRALRRRGCRPQGGRADVHPGLRARSADPAASGGHGPRHRADRGQLPGDAGRPARLGPRLRRAGASRVYVVDQVGVGAPARPGGYGAYAGSPALALVEPFSPGFRPVAAGPAPDAVAGRPLAPGDPVFDQFFASQVEYLARRAAGPRSSTRRQLALLERIGPAVARRPIRHPGCSAGRSRTTGRTS